MPIRLGIVDSHKIFIESLEALLARKKFFDIVLTARSSDELKNKLAVLRDAPEILLLDTNLPTIGGFAVSETIRGDFPSIKIIALSKRSDEFAVSRMFDAGCCSFCLKDIDAEELESTILLLHKNGNYRNSRPKEDSKLWTLRNENGDNIKIPYPEMNFLKLACSDLTYKEIADKMNISEKSVDRYRDLLFNKLNVKSRVGLCMQAIKNGWIEVAP